jgi:hypothetical protein
VLVRSSSSLLPFCFLAATDTVELEELTFRYGDARFRPRFAVLFRKLGVFWSTTFRRNLRIDFIICNTIQAKHHYYVQLLAC